MQTRPIRRFTGWHMTGILAAFFAVVIAVNVLMATVAIRSFGGTVVDNSYVESQKFNQYLAQARAQDRLGWKDDVALDPARHVTLALTDNAGKPIHEARITAVAEHPLGRALDIAITFHETAPGHYVGDRALPAGRWQLRADINHGAQHLLREVF
ncbi:Nitrogen fixation protein FixH [Sphingobium sp. AP50]|uniref:FixH family protein n=1 Tax=Sphingobium sp. AP50 TaxID=1884369 RepID=UPI0008B5779A|nr:FixH family protein [Sphingobium sp. AP50]SEJ00001.1 Nitrogen fixation protein FixH [Sphingobium sp. AP50]